MVNDPQTPIVFVSMRVSFTGTDVSCQICVRLAVVKKLVRRVLSPNQEHKTHVMLSQETHEMKYCRVII